MKYTGGGGGHENDFTAHAQGGLLLFDDSFLHEVRMQGGDDSSGCTQVIPHHETFRTTKQPSYSSTKG
jgi:hypothetical protein